MRKTRKTTRGIYVNAWIARRNLYVCFVDDDWKHRTYHNVTPSSLRRAQRAQLALMERGQAE